MTAKKKRILWAASLAACAFLAFLLFPLIRRLYRPGLWKDLAEWVRSLGIGGYAILLVLQMLQVIVAFIPGEPFELAAGALCGGWGGLILCMVGSTAASALVFSIARRLGKPLLRRLFRKRQLESFAFFRDGRKLEIVTLVLFLLPGTPKDMLTYVAGTTSISPHRFLAVSAFARIPSVASSVFLADSMLAGDWKTALILTAATFALGLGGILLREPILRACKKGKNMGKGEGEAGT